MGEDERGEGSGDFCSVLWFVPYSSMVVPVIICSAQGR
jgi:hypothetical protein